MSIRKINIAVGFTDQDQNARFLFQIINYGKIADELKFLFIKAKEGRKIITSEVDKDYPFESLISTYVELSYHKDGTLIWKYPEHKIGKKFLRRNPHGEGSRRTPLKKISMWEPVFSGNIIRYNNCPILTKSESEIIHYYDNIFSGEPFEYHVFLGNNKFQSPPNNKRGELVYRINSITSNLDMVIWVRKSSYFGEPFKIGDQTFINNNNRVRISEPSLQIKDGAVQLDISLLMNTEWYGNIVDDNMRLNVKSLKNLAPRHRFCKSYLNDNPYLKQLIELVGYNRGFAISIFYEGRKLNHEMVGIIDKDEKGSFLGIGSAADSQL